MPEGRTMTHDTTLLDLVAALTRQCGSEREVIATAIALVDSGAVRLCGNFRGERFAEEVR